MRALFGDVDLHPLRRIAIVLDIDGKTLALAYRAARRRTAAANEDLDEFAAQFDASRERARARTRPRSLVSICPTVGAASLGPPTEDSSGLTILADCP